MTGGNLHSQPIPLELLQEATAPPAGTRAQEYPETLADGSRPKPGHRGPSLRRKVGRRKRLRMIHESRPARLLEAIPGPEEEVILLLDGSYHGMDVLGAFLELAAPARIQELYLATLAINVRHTNRLARLLGDGAIGSLVIIVSELFSKNSGTEWVNLVHQIREAQGQTVATSRNHAKLIAAKLEDGRTVTAHGSLNLRSCHSFEQLAVSGDPELFDFFRGFIVQIATTGRPIP